MNIEYVSISYYIIVSVHPNSIIGLPLPVLPPYPRVIYTFCHPFIIHPFYLSKPPQHIFLRPPQQITLHPTILPPLL